jgi:hypothetical protein
MYYFRNRSPSAPNDFIDAPFFAASGNTEMAAAQASTPPG